MLSWRRGPLPTPEAGMSVLVFRPHFDLRCAATVFYLTAASFRTNGDIVWGSLLEREEFTDELTDEDWWAPLGPDALFVISDVARTLP